MGTGSDSKLWDASADPLGLVLMEGGYNGLGQLCLWPTRYIEWLNSSTCEWNNQYISAYRDIIKK